MHDSAGLLSKLVPYPSGARPWTHNKTGVLTLDEFDTIFYKVSVQGEERSLLARRRFSTAVRHGWYNADGTQAEVFLVEFSSSTGAQGMYLALTSEWKQDTTSGTAFTDPAVHGTGELEPALDSSGNMTAKETAYVGHTFIYVRYYDPAAPNKTEVMRLVQHQYRLVGGH
ncbi:hypothetical protein [Actinacidiphila oryziradicis]|uniref:Uncharacterized protein n=1 Tax=Actinacidiphila oryziradicis TaxID=2571141 RepID=A0A4U0RWQ3_9ACTN|nr:hypothetical protein [Actinacidiphila oryziradicis]TKA00732.1 hypothetical protein FCI23_42215 [Actinacidiphila oryziradicis]